MRILKQRLIFFAVGLALAGCKLDAITLSSGKADFKRYIALGNSLTAGYADGGLYLESQKSSYPSIIAGQMEALKGGSFTQPLFSESQADGSGYLKITGFDANGLPVTTMVANNLAIRSTGTGKVLYTKYSGEINNYGVSGIKLRDMLNTNYGNLNPYFERLLPGDPPAHNNAYVDFATATPFTFFSNWLGNNDALGFALDGGAGDELTDPAEFRELYDQLISRLTAAGQKGVVGTIPDVTAIPYFNTITVDAVLMKVKTVDPTVQGIYINARKDAATANYTARKAIGADLLLLNAPADKIGEPVNTPYGRLPYGVTPYSAIDNKYVLDTAEVALAKSHVTAYNTAIKAIASHKGVAVFDAYNFLNDVKQHGIVTNSITMTSEFLTGGLFSVDGVHLTPRGYALIANQFMIAINQKYGSALKQVDVSKYRGVKMP